MWLKFSLAHFLKVSSPQDSAKGRYGCLVVVRYNFPIHSHKKSGNANFLITFYYMMQMSSYSHHSIIPMSKTFSQIFVKIRHDDVAWRHMTSFFKNVPKKVLTSSKICTMGQYMLIFQIQPNNTFPTSGQPLPYDKRFNFYQIFNFCRIIDDVITKIADVSKIRTSR